MTVATLRINSQALSRPVPYTAILPYPDDAGPGPYPVLVQLHGYWDDHQAWIYKSNLARYVERLPLIVVIPNGENGYWVNWDPTRRYEDFIVRDLWDHVNGTFPVREGARWAIGGLSMGGFGALRLGLKYPDLGADGRRAPTRLTSVDAHGAGKRTRHTHQPKSSEKAIAKPGVGPGTIRKINKNLFHKFLFIFLFHTWSDGRPFST